MARFFVAWLALLLAAPAIAAPPHAITIDGNFDDWQDIPSYFDPADDTHDTDHRLFDDVPEYVDHPDVDLLEFKFTHDNENLYAYFRARGVIGRTQHSSQGTPGRYYVIVTIDVDDDEETGYWLHEGGYFPTSGGYDMNMEVEYFDGEFNTGHYLNHGCLNQEEFFAAQQDQAMEIVDVRPGTYRWYTQWVMFHEPQGYPEEIILPSGRSIVWVADRGPVYQGIITIHLSPDGHEAEMKAPFIGFMRYPNGDPIMALRRKINVSFSLEASSELAPGRRWASDTADPIMGYVLEPRHSADLNRDGRISFEEAMRAVQLFNAGSYHCAAGSEDGYAPGEGVRTCQAHDADYRPQDWEIEFSELLRIVQLYNSDGYIPCDEGEDGYCPNP